MINAISFSPTAVIGFSPYAPLPLQTWSRRTKMFLLLAQGWIKRIVLQVLHYHHPSFSILPSYQVVNAKKKLKKKRYINSGTVSSQIRAKPRGALTPSAPLCFCIHQEVSSKWIAWSSSALLNVFVPFPVAGLMIQTVNLSRWENILVTWNGVKVRSNA